MGVNDGAVWEGTWVMEPDGSVRLARNDAEAREAWTVDRHIAVTTFGGIEVSTVFLPVNHGWGGEVRVFETMVFRNGDGGDTHRYSTRDEAVEGHRSVVDSLKREVFGAEWFEGYERALVSHGG